MKRIVLVLLAVFALVLGSSVPSDAFRGGGHFGGGHVSSGHFGGGHFGGGHGHGHFGVDFVVGPVFGPWWWDTYPYYYPYPSTPVVVQSQPELYVEPQSPEQQYWYYCGASGGYYPYVKRCPGGWTKVAPTP